MSREKLLKQLTDLNEAVADSFESAQPVYHYTSAEGLRGIIDSGEIWLTNTAFVNDTMECKAFWDLKREDVFGTGTFPNTCVDTWWKQRARAPRDDYAKYIVSFSEAEESLTQFRMYGSFCIGFDASRLARKGFHLYRCVYTRREIKEWIREKSVIKQWNGDCLDDGAKRAAGHMLLFVASVKYKNEHYKDEREVRLLCKSNHTWERWPNSPFMYEEDPPIHFRDHPVHNMPVPYVKFFTAPEEAKRDSLWCEYSPKEKEREMKSRKLKEEAKMLRCSLPITAVRIGPMAQQEEAKLACEIMLREKGYENVPVIASKIPYRGS